MNIKLYDMRHYGTSLSPIAAALIVFVVAVVFSACSRADKKTVDRLNDISYAYHYRNLDSTLVYAQKAYDFARGSYSEGEAEALNNMAFVSIARMNYKRAFMQADSAASASNSEIEQLVADVQHMRLCQRQSQNKDFYTYRERALKRIARINEERDMLDDHLRRRVLYAMSEFDIVNSTYYYYVGLEEQSINALAELDGETALEQDTAQWLAYLYNVGAGGIITQGSSDEINQVEMDYLLRCHVMAKMAYCPFWEANSLQAISEHLQEPSVREKLVADNLPVIKSINTDNMPDSLLAGNLAQRSLELFQQYGDVYQIAGAYRTLAQCYWQINDYSSSLYCLNEALVGDTAINQAPDLVASIREQLSVVYAALDEKQQSDYNRNIYLDLQEQTRQDRYLESRADSLDHSLKQLNVMILLIVVLLVLGVILGIFYWYRRNNDDSDNTLNELLRPLESWRKENEQRLSARQNEHDEIVEEQQVAALHLADNKRRNLEQRAKAALVTQVTPLIDRMLLEIKKLARNNEAPQLRKERYAYVSELSDQINLHNSVLTQWIQLRQGELNLHIESFPLQDLFHIVSRGKTGFSLKGVTLDVKSTDCWVKADRVLTLFMINTIADNARKFTAEGGKVTISAQENDSYIEVAVEDTGIGMTDEQIKAAFSVDPHSFGDDSREQSATYSSSSKDRGHGFGLVNCKGIIEKYKKISPLFNVCTIGVTSRLGEGSRFFFRLPRGLRKGVMAILLLIASVAGMEAQVSTSHASNVVTVSDSRLDSLQRELLSEAAVLADSAYFCNTRGEYEKTLIYADSVRTKLNECYRILCPEGEDFLQQENEKAVALPEIVWFHQNLPFDYDVILDMRNESAVAALALHKWSLYRYNNKVYTQLFKEKSADQSLGDYCRMMQKSQSDKMVAIYILIILLLILFVAWFFLYYRHRMYFRFCIERVRDINNILLSSKTEEEKLALISEKAGDLGRRSAKSTTVKGDSSLLGLQKVVAQVTDALGKSIQADKQSQINIELAQDELKRQNYENEKFYVSNNVLDNCLSTLKHETMYYPSRIKALVTDGDANLPLIDEMASYYQELYMLLCVQTSRQVQEVGYRCVPAKLQDLLPPYVAEPLPQTTVAADEELVTYLFEILKKLNNKEKPTVTVVQELDRYTVLSVDLNNFDIEGRNCDELFSPAMDNIPFLLCRQIARESGEMANARGCGIVAEASEQGGIKLNITLPKWK